MRKILFWAAMFGFILTSSAWGGGADISGKWTLSMWGAGAEESFPVVFKAAGENLTVTATHPGFNEMTGTGTLKGNDISFNLKAASMEIVFTGKVAGNKMEGTREIKASGDGRGGGAPGGAPDGAAPQGGMPPGGGMPDGTGGTGGAPAGGQGAGTPDQGEASTEGHENFVAVKN